MADGLAALSVHAQQDLATLLAILCPPLCAAFFPRCPFAATSYSVVHCLSNFQCNLVESAHVMHVRTCRPECNAISASITVHDLRQLQNRLDTSLPGNNVSSADHECMHLCQTDVFIARTAKSADTLLCQVC